MGVFITGACEGSAALNGEDGVGVLDLKVEGGVVDARGRVLLQVRWVMIR